MKLNLFTGKIGYCDSFKKIKNNSLLLIEMLVTNLIGVMVTTVLYAVTDENFVITITAIAAAKFSKNIFVLFIHACYCGMLIHFAVKNNKTIITVFAIMIFILIGAEHCIADFPYLLFSFSFINIIKFLSIILGNSLGAILIEKLSKSKNTGLV